MTALFHEGERAAQQRAAKSARPHGLDAARRHLL